ncbi:MAG: hypothetical protein AB9836_04545 [Aminipila sp.]
MKEQIKNKEKHNSRPKNISSEYFFKNLADKINRVHNGNSRAVRNKRITSELARDYYWDAIESALDEIIVSMQPGQRINIGNYISVEKQYISGKKQDMPNGEKGELVSRVIPDKIKVTLKSRDAFKKFTHNLEPRGGDV